MKERWLRAWMEAAGASMEAPGTPPQVRAEREDEAIAWQNALVAKYSCPWGTLRHVWDMGDEIQKLNDRMQQCKDVTSHEYQGAQDERDEIRDKRKALMQQYGRQLKAAESEMWAAWRIWKDGTKSSLGSLAARIR